MGLTPSEGEQKEGRKEDRLGESLLGSSVV